MFQVVSLSLHGPYLGRADIVFHVTMSGIRLSVHAINVRMPLTASLRETMDPGQARDDDGDDASRSY